jgi:pyruvate dehydrogenase E1 component alpha subunit
MRKKPRPYLLEAHTYRYRGHSVSDPATYRTKEEVQEYQKKDPLLKLADQLKKQKLADDATLTAWDSEVRGRVTEIEEFADQSAKPDVSEIWQHVFAD